MNSFFKLITRNLEGAVHSIRCKHSKPHKNITPLAEEEAAELLQITLFIIERELSDVLLLLVVGMVVFVWITYVCITPRKLN